MQGIENVREVLTERAMIGEAPLEFVSDELYFFNELDYQEAVTNKTFGVGDAEVYIPDYCSLTQPCDDGDIISMNVSANFQFTL